MAEDSALLAAAGRIADGEDIDWASITSTLSTPEDLKLADELALVAQIAAGHRLLHVLLPMAPVTPANLVPDRARWGHLDLLNVVGRGSFGVVYRAWDTRLERLVALKLFHGASHPDSVMQEGRMLARVRHENVVIVHGAQRARDVSADGRGFPRLERPDALDLVVERAAVHQLHPDAGGAVEDVGAVNRHDVLVPHAREHAAFLHHFVGIRGAVEQLQRHEPLEAHVPRAVDDAVGAASDDVQQIEVSPPGAIGHQVGRRVRHVRQQLVQLAMTGGDLRDDRELVGQRAVVRRRQRRGDRSPVDELAVGDASGRAQQRLLVSHGASPRRA